MRKIGFFGAFILTKYSLDVTNILAADNVRIDTLPVHSPERQYYFAFCTYMWKLEWTASNAAAVYRSAYEANYCAFPLNEKDGIREAITRAELAAKRAELAAFRYT